MGETPTNIIKRNHLWKLASQDLVTALWLRIRVCHFPPGTSKWSRVEHRMLSHLAQNWRGRPLTSQEVIINLIANTATRQGLIVQAELGTSACSTCIEISDEELVLVTLF